MNTENYFALECAERDMPHINSGEMEIIKTHLDVTREIQNTYHLLQMFYYNIKVLLTNFDVQASDIYTTKLHCPDDVDIFHGVNAQVTNCISSAKTLIEVFELHSVIQTKFKLVINAKFDTSFYYKFLISLRHFSQHGNIPVSVKNGQFYFDLKRILEIPKFTHNKHMKKLLVDTIEKMQKQNIAPHIAVTLTLSGFTVDIFETHLVYLQEIKKILDKSKGDLDDLLSKRPELEQEHPHFMLPMVFYQDDEGEVHAFANEDSHEMFSNYLSQVTNQLKIEKASFDYLKGAFSFDK